MYRHPIVASQLYKQHKGRLSYATLTLVLLLTLISALASTSNVSQASDLNTYPWGDALDVNPSNYDWGYATCPSSAPNCKEKIIYKNGTGYGVYDPWSYYFRNCTSFVAHRVSQEFNGRSIAGWGNAISWDEGAEAAGYTKSGTPQVGDIVQWDTGVYGHVGYVYEVNGNTASIAEYNQAGTGSYANLRTISADTAGVDFIHMGAPAGSSALMPYTVFQSNTNHLHAFHAAAQSTTLGLAPGTSPSTTKLSDGSYQTAFQANNGNLYVYNSANGGSATDLGYSMAPGSSPSISAFPGGGWQIAYRKNYTGHLSLYNSTNGNQDLTLGLASGSSPSITVLSNSAFQVAFQSNTGTLYVYNNNSGAGSLGQGMAVNTSPAITALSTGTWQIAFQANTNSLHTYNWPSGAGNLNAGMAAGTSPAIASLSSSAYQIAFQANTGTLHVHNNSSGTANLGLGMYAGTSPSIAAKDAGSWQAVMQANTGNLFKYYFNLNGTGSSDMGQGMSASTSPAITF